MRKRRWSLVAGLVGLVALAALFVPPAADDTVPLSFLKGKAPGVVTTSSYVPSGVVEKRGKFYMLDMGYEPAVERARAELEPQGWQVFSSPLRRVKGVLQSASSTFTAPARFGDRVPKTIEIIRTMDTNGRPRDQLEVWQAEPYGSFWQALRSALRKSLGI